jgi:MFS family permease
MVRVWMPLFLQEGRGFQESSMLAINSGYFLAADLGCWLAGGACMWMARSGWPVESARRWTYLACCLLCSTSLLTLVVTGGGVVVLLLLVGAGCLGLFPIFYALSQELSQRHQGKTIGLLGTIAWLVLAPLQPLFGRIADRTGSYDWGIALVGLVPLASCLVLWTLWSTNKESLARPLQVPTGASHD